MATARSIRPVREHQVPTDHQRSVISKVRTQEGVPGGCAVTSAQFFPLDITPKDLRKLVGYYIGKLNKLVYGDYVLPDEKPSRTGCHELKKLVRIERALKDRVALAVDYFNWLDVLKEIIGYEESWNDIFGILSDLTKHYRVKEPESMEAINNAKRRIQRHLVVVNKMLLEDFNKIHVFFDDRKPATNYTAVNAEELGKEFIRKWRETLQKLIDLSILIYEDVSY